MASSSSAATLRARFAQEYPWLPARLHTWRRCRTPNGWPAIEARVDRAKWPDGPAKLRAFLHPVEGDLIVESVGGGRGRATVLRRATNERYLVGDYPAGNPALN